jgi:mono/diheme cytochrome c family protein
MQTKRSQSWLIAAAVTLVLPAGLAAQGDSLAAAANQRFVVDASQAKKGQSLWNSRGCTGCHSIGGGKRSGPDLAGVLELRDIGWLRRWLKNPTQMLETDSLAQSLLAQYNNTKMPNLRLADADIEALLHYIGQETERRRPQTPSP